MPVLYLILPVLPCKIQDRYYIWLPNINDVRFKPAPRGVGCSKAVIIVNPQ